MDPLFHNPIANMYGPYFLFFYFIIATSAVIFTAVILQRQDRNDAPPSVSANPDPYEIAYLRGGVNEVIRVVVLALLQRGVLEQRIGIKAGRLKASMPPTITVASGGPSPDSLQPLEKAVVIWCWSPRQPPEFFTGTLPQEFKRLCAGYERDLMDSGLLTRPEEQQARNRIALPIALAVLALGGYKIWAALETGHNNIGFLIVEMIAAVIAFAVVGNTPRATRRGRQYIQHLQIAYQNLKRPGVRSASNGAVDPALLALAVFGVAALAGTPEAAYAAMFRQASGASSGGCGSSSGGCGGSGGGGGCGGGGGGGCGGCGGGG
jgi:uncharacterized protein (TIGR04222 family)